jgi:hypothetical protein
MRDCHHLALAHRDHTVRQSLEHIGVKVAEISSYMKGGNLSPPIFEHFLPATDSLQDDGTKIDRHLGRHDRLT